MIRIWEMGGRGNGCMVDERIGETSCYRDSQGHSWECTWGDRGLGDLIDH